MIPGAQISCSFLVIFSNAYWELIICHGLRLVPPKDFAFNNTGTPITSRFLGGNMDGIIGTAQVELGPYTVDSQGTGSALLISPC